MYNSETRGAQNRDGFYFRQLNIPKNSGWFFLISLLAHPCQKLTQHDLITNLTREPIFY